MEIKLLDTPVNRSDWKDRARPLRYELVGNGERHLFVTKKDAELYRRLLRRYDPKTAFRMYCAS